ncbi:MAG: type 2 isopentenyl-diphosphate Delta-isomerase [Ignavibacteriaceae bacterium]|nr:type 2 isopentenyl-diphosphate Delta-isomerase [Ignavibacteriaceae bacterium]
MQEDQTVKRKKEHLKLCLTADVKFKSKTTGFENYEFTHCALTEVEIDKINFETKFFKKKINYPFLISCMTGGTTEAENINAQLAIAAEELKIPIGVGSQRQALEDDKHLKSYKIIRKNARNVPVLGNLGAAQIVQLKKIDVVQKLNDQIEADAMVVHLNPLQELLQKEGEPNFKGLLKQLGKLVKHLNVPIIVKEVGAGISGKTAKELLEAGVEGIDVAGAGGTSWAGVEILRNKSEKEKEFWDWGLPTSYCIKDVYKLKKYYKFILIGSGGINSSIEAAKAIALGADIVASARIILQTLNKSGIEGVKNLITNWFDFVKSVMFLTGSNTLNELRKNKLILKELLY